MPIQIAPHWFVGSYGTDHFVGDNLDDTFELGGTWGVGGVQNSWDTFNGNGGYDNIRVAVKSGFVWTAVMIADNGLSNVEAITAYTGTYAPVYFAGAVNFSDVVSLSANIRIFGRANDNHFTGGVVGEYVEGDGGNDTLFGNGGDDTLYGDTTSVNQWAATYAPGDDTLYGGVGNDALYGQGGNDRLFGEVGDDRLEGGDGNDLLDGGAGNNLVWGGAGDDVFRFKEAGDRSAIHDFTAGSDTFLIDTSIAGTFADLSFYDDANGNGHIVAGDIDITVIGHAAATFTSSQFQFELIA